MNNYSRVTDLFTYSFRFPTPQLYSVAIALDVNVLLPILDLPVKLGLLTPGIVEVC